MKTHKEIFYALYPNGYVDFAIGRTYNVDYVKNSNLPEGVVSGMRWDDDLKEYIPTFKIATNRLGR